MKENTEGNKEMEAWMSSADMDILMITYNRPSYTALSLPRLLDTCDETMRVWVWHNGTDKRTLDVVRRYLNHPRVYRFFHSTTNKKLREPTNWFLDEAEAPVLAKVDDDLIMPSKWGQRMCAAHQSNPKVGVLGTWPFFREDIRPKIAEQKVMRLAHGDSLMLNCWVGGGGVVVKKNVIKDIGFLGPNESFPHWMKRACSRGHLVGWLYPFIIAENCDDPRSQYCMMKTDEDVSKHSWLSKTEDKKTIADVVQNIQKQAIEVQQAPYDIGRYIGPRSYVYRLANKCRRWYYKVSMKAGS